jgi:penicillin-binding protein 1A
MRTKIILAVVVVIVGLLAGALLALVLGIPSVDELKKYDRAAGTKIYADDDTLIGEIKLQKGIFIPLSKMPVNLKNAIVAVEDRRFWQHSGIDYLGIARALVKDILSLSLKEGGSTLTQQLAKIVYLSSEKTIVRKVKEAQLALTIEKNLSKKDILELYLNRAYFGHSAYGVEMAARTYFGKSVTNINLAEAAMIAGLVKAPNTYSPINDLVKAKERQAVVLNRMVEEGYIKQAQADAAKTQHLQLVQTRDATDTFNYFIDYIRQYLVTKYGEERVYRGNLKVHTTLDRRVQANAQKALQEGLRDVDKRRGWRGPIGFRDNVKESDEEKTSFAATSGQIAKGVVVSVGPKEAVVKSRGLTGKLALADARWAASVIDRPGAKPRYIKDFNLTHILKKGDMIFVRFKSGGKSVSFSLEQEPEVEGAVAVVEPSTGYIRALVGGYSYIRSEFNRAVMAKRQPGSSFKPVVYAAALEGSYTPASIVNDEPASFGSWTPANSDRKYLGPIRLREGLAFSRNIITVKMVQEMGVDKVINMARGLGIQGSIPSNLTIALGSASVSPLEMASAFAVFANSGVRMKHRAIKYITTGRGEVIESSQSEPSQALSAAGAFLLTSMLEDVIKYGTGARANIGRPAAGKTGTSNDYKDAWFVGYTPELSAAVWVGFDDMGRSIGHGEVGGRAAAPIWKRLMSASLAGREAAGFSMPAGVVTARIDKVTGLLADPMEPESETLLEYFREGTQPTSQAGRNRGPRQPLPLEIED